MNTFFLICFYGEKNLFPKKLYRYRCRNTRRSVNILIVIDALITPYINFCISFGFRETSVINCSLIESIMPFLVVLSVNVIAANIFRFFYWNIHLSITKTEKSISRANRSHVQLQSHRRSNCWKFENNPMCHWHSKNIQLKNAKIFCRIFFSLQLACDHHRVVSLCKTYITRCCTLYTNKT